MICNFIVVEFLTFALPHGLGSTIGVFGEGSTRAVVAAGLARVRLEHARRAVLAARQVRSGVVEGTGRTANKKLG